MKGREGEGEGEGEGELGVDSGAASYETRFETGHMLEDYGIGWS